MRTFPVCIRSVVAGLAALLLAACAAPTDAPVPLTAADTAVPPIAEPSATPVPTETPLPTATLVPVLTPTPTPGPGLGELLQTPAALYLNADLDGASAAYTALVRLYPDRADPLLGLAAVALRQGDNPAALEYLEEATAAEPLSFEAWRQLAVLLEQQGRAAEAANAYGQMIALVPSDPNLYTARAMALARLGRGAEAVADLQAAQIFDPYREYAWLNAAGAAYGARAYEAAIEIAAAALDAYPQSAGLLVMRGQALMSLGDARAALDDFDTVVALDDRSIAAHLWRGRALLALGQVDEAVEALQRAGELGVRAGAIGAEQGYEAIALAAGALARTDAQAAFDYLAGQVIQHGQPPALMFGYALIERGRGSDANALGRLNSLIQLDEYIPAYLERAQIEAAAGNAEAAIADLRVYLAARQAGPDVEIARALLERLGADPDGA